LRHSTRAPESHKTYEERSRQTSSCWSDNEGMRKATVALVVICLAVTYVMAPVFISTLGGPSPLLTLTVTDGGCHGRGLPACNPFSVTFRNLSPWPMYVHGHWDFVPSIRLMPRSTYAGPPSLPANDFTLAPFGVYGFTVSVWSETGLGVSETVPFDVTFSGEVVVLWGHSQPVHVSFSRFALY